MTAPAREPRPSSDTAPDNEAAACRRMWAAAVLAFYTDWWAATARAKGDPAVIARIRADAHRWASTKWGRHVLTMAGVDEADPDRVADAAVDLTAHDRTLREASSLGRVGSPTGPHAGAVPSDAPQQAYETPLRGPVPAKTSRINIDEVRRLAAQGLSLRQVAAEMGFLPSSISRVALTHGIAFAARRKAT